MAKSNLPFIKAVIGEHKALWLKRMPTMRKYKNCYLTRFWAGETFPDDQIRIETADAYAYIESYISSLFSKDPSVEVGPDVRPSGDPKLVQSVCNRFLGLQRQVLSDASRMALIYPMSFFKLSTCKVGEDTSILDQISLQSVAPWQVIVDREANGWGDQRYVGHTYYMPVSQARERWGAKKWLPVVKQDYFGAETVPGGKDNSVPDEYLFIEVVELYDLINDKLFFWTPNWSGGEDVLETIDIPLRGHDNTPLVPLIPLYYGRVPDEPLEGISAMERMYDQFFEKNIGRSWWASAIRRDSRQYLYRADAIDEESVAKITAGIDGLMIPIETDALDGLIREVPNTAISSNHDRYLNMVEADLSRGSVLASFTRGEATGATATEVAALNQYSASEIGKMARERDGAIEMIAYVYTRMIALLADEENERDVVLVNRKPEIINAEKLEGKFRYVALDQANTPLATAAKKAQLVELMPLLGQLGVSNEKILKEMVRLFELPEAFGDVEPPEAAPEAPPVPPTDTTAISTEADAVQPPVGPDILSKLG